MKCHTCKTVFEKAENLFILKGFELRCKECFMENLKEKDFALFEKMVQNMNETTQEQATERLKNYQEKESEFYRKVTEDKSHLKK
jgi:hypothetical protein